MEERFWEEEVVVSEEMGGCGEGRVAKVGSRQRRVGPGNDPK